MTLSRDERDAIETLQRKLAEQEEAIAQLQASLPRSAKTGHFGREGHPHRAIALGGAGGTNELVDADGDTKYEVEKTADDDTHRITIKSTEEGNWDTNRFLINNVLALDATNGGGIASGVTSPTSSLLILSSETGSTDDLESIDDANVNEQGAIIRLCANSGHTITVKDNTGADVSERIHTIDNKDFVLIAAIQSFLEVAYFGGALAWQEVNRGSAASTTAGGVVELATTAEINTGTDATRVITPDLFAASDFGTRIPVVTCIAFATNWTVADGHGRFPIPPELNNMDLVDVRVYAVTAGTTGTGNVTVDRLRGVTTVLMTSTAVTLNDGATFASDGVINTSFDDVNTDDVLIINVDAIHTTPAKGLIVTLVFRIP